MAVRVAEPEAVMLAKLVSLTIQEASGRGRPRLSTAVNCLVSPTTMFDVAGVICNELGTGGVGE